MVEKDIRDAYESIKINGDMDKRIKEAILTEESSARNPLPKTKHQSGFWKRTAVIAAATVITLTGASQIPQVQTFADTIAETFTTIFRLDGEDVEVKSEYVVADEDASKQDEKFDNIKQIEKELGVKLLKSDQSFEEKNSWSYYPMVTNEGELFAATLTHGYYILGDLKGVQPNYFADPNTVNNIQYEAGQEFRSPIQYQMLLRIETDNPDEIDIESYRINDISWTKDEHAVKYHIENLDADAVMMTVKTDGPSAWEQNELADTTFMMFVYKGVEYHFCGQVSMDTMKEIAENLYE